MTLKMSDIAKMANVSKTAVSLTINGKEGVSEETRQKILDIIAEQGYTPLRKSHKENAISIGEVTFLVVTTSGVVRDNYRSLPFFSSLISALSAEISKLNGSLRTVTIQSQELASKIDSVDDRQGAGILVLGTDLTEEQALLIRAHVPQALFIDTYFENITSDFITMDNYQGAYLAGKYILAQGYHKIGYFASEKITSNFNERRRGFQAALKGGNVTVAPEHFYYIPPTGLEAHDIDVQQIVTDLPEAIFCEDDYIAIRLLKAVQEAGLKVPEDIAIMGFDDIYEDTLVSPELTTIHVSVEQMVQQALYQLTQRLHSREWNPQKTLFATTLKRRQSL